MCMLLMVATKPMLLRGMLPWLGKGSNRPAKDLLHLHKSDLDQLRDISPPDFIDD